MLLHKSWRASFSVGWGFFLGNKNWGENKLGTRKMKKHRRIPSFSFQNQKLLKKEAPFQRFFLCSVAAHVGSMSGIMNHPNCSLYHGSFLNRRTSCIKNQVSTIFQAGSYGIFRTHETTSPSIFGKIMLQVIQLRSFRGMIRLAMVNCHPF